MKTHKQASDAYPRQQTSSCSQKSPVPEKKKVLLTTPRPNELGIAPPLVHHEQVAKFAFVAPT